MGKISRSNVTVRLLCRGSPADSLLTEKSIDLQRKTSKRQNIHF
jgi:hypothetical protein